MLVSMELERDKKVYSGTMFCGSSSSIWEEVVVQQVVDVTTWALNSCRILNVMEKKTYIQL